MMKRVAWVLAVLAGSFFIGTRVAKSDIGTLAASARTGPTTRSDVVRRAFPRGYVHSISTRGPTIGSDGLLCAGGQEPSLHAEVIPTTLVTTGANSTLEFDLDVKSDFAKEMSFASSLEVVDDQGTAMQAPSLSSASRLAPGAVASRSSRTPSGLKEGYYIVRGIVTAESSDQSERESVTAELYVHADATGITPISIDEWLEKSRTIDFVRVP